MPLMMQMPATANRPAVAYHCDQRPGLESRFWTLDGERVPACVGRAAWRAARRQAGRVRPRGGERESPPGEGT